MTQRPWSACIPRQLRPCRWRSAYLQRALHRRAGPLVYANFISSLDGRIALADAGGVVARMPTAVLNARDWRLYQELVAQADVVLAGRSYLRFRHREAHDARLRLLDPIGDRDLVEWRVQQGLSPEPALAMVTCDLVLSEALVRAVRPRPLYIVTSRQAPVARISALERAGAEVLSVGAKRDVTGAELVNALHAAGFDRICSVAGPRVLHMLLQDDCLARLYLTLGLRVLDAASGATASQLFGVYTRASLALSGRDS